MKVCFVVLHHNTTRREPSDYLDDVPVHRHLPQAVAARGNEVSLVHLSPFDARLRERNVDYHFVAEPRLIRRLAGMAGGLLNQTAARFEPALRTLLRVRALKPDVVHVHGVDLYLNLAFLRALNGVLRAPVVLHFHGGYPAARRSARVLQRFSFAGVRHFLFTTRSHADPFLKAGLIGRPDDVTPFMEVSSTFRVRPREACRQETGMFGRPVFVWTGRLHPVKDPLTALRGFEGILDAWPDARLYMYYRTDGLLPEVRAFLRERPAVSDRVQLRGAAAYPRMESIYNSADFFLQASRREFSGCAVLEAVSCGVLPVVTDLPSFRVMTHGGRHGALFPVGDPEALARAALSLKLDSVPQRSVAARSYFEKVLSFEALAEQLERVYRGIA